MKIKHAIIAWIIQLSVAGLMSATLENLRCEYLNNPLGIDAGSPRLSWELNAKDERQFKQTAYQILVASSEDLLKADKGELLRGTISVSDIIFVTACCLLAPATRSPLPIHY